jgi:hypothetical protein
VRYVKEQKPRSLFEKSEKHAIDHLSTMALAPTDRGYLPTLEHNILTVKQ